MSYSSPIIYTVVPMDRLLVQPTIVTTTMQEEQPRPLKQKNTHRSTPIFSSMLRTLSGSDGRFYGR
jgi:hypothetical protein